MIIKRYFIPAVMVFALLIGAVTTSAATVNQTAGTTTDVCDMVRTEVTQDLAVLDAATTQGLNNSQRAWVNRYREILAKASAACVAVVTTTTSTTVTPSTTTTTAPPTTTTSTTTPPGGSTAFNLNPATYGQNQAFRDPGSNTLDITPATYLPVRQPGDSSAAFRTDCSLSHSSYADPIVTPGGTVGHLHNFFGNAGTDAQSTPESIRTTGASTCSGGIANRSSYWAPAMINYVGSAPYNVVPTCPDDTQQCFYDRISALQIYYKSGYDGIAPQTIQNFPPGLRMVAGTVTSAVGQPGITEYHCAAGPGSDAGTYSNNSTSIPNCQVGHLLIMSIEFPQCWDGVNLDSPNHKSHMAYGVGWPDLGCPASHPVPLAQITQNFRWRVPTTGMANWRLSSDTNLSVPRGYTGHADWMNGWDFATFQRIVDNCYHVDWAAGGANDCSVNLLGEEGPPGLPGNFMLG